MASFEEEEEGQGKDGLWRICSTPRHYLAQTGRDGEIRIGGKWLDGGLEKCEFLLFKNTKCSISVLNRLKDAVSREMKG